MRQHIVGLELSRPCSICGVGDTQLKMRTLVGKGADKRAHCLPWDESFKMIMFIFIICLGLESPGRHTWL